MHRPQQPVGRLGAVTSCVLPHRPSDGAGDSDEELQPQSPPLHRRSGEDREANCAPRLDVVLMLMDDPKGSGRSDDKPPEPGIGHHQIATPAQNQHRKVRLPPGGGHPVEGAPIGHLCEIPGRAAQLVGGVAAHSDTCLHHAGIDQAVEGVHEALAASRASSSPGTTVMSPAPIVITVSPGTTRSARNPARSARWAT